MIPHMSEKSIDLLVIGGGINGTAIAADAAGRGLSVTLCEQDDLANHTSSQSSKLVHGGLRYLEQCHFKLVRESLTEREVLLNTAPHLVHPLEFIIPHYRYSRPTWLLKFGLFLYDHIGKANDLPRSQSILLKDIAGNPIQDNIHQGLTYTDCNTDDARLVVTVALRAQEKGADILPRHKVIHTKRHSDYWEVVVLNQNTNAKISLKAKMLVNAAGPWVDIVQSEQLHEISRNHIQLIKGSHLVFKRLYPGNHAYLLQHPDKRIIFVIPYQNDFTLIGTTDVPYQGNPANPTMDKAEKQYLCDIVNQYFKTSINAQDAVWEYSGVRPLVSQSKNNASEVTRGYRLELHDQPNQAPLLSVFGGKLTTHRHLAEDAMAQVKKVFPHLGPSWTATTPLPGGDLPTDSFTGFLQRMQHDYPWLPKQMVIRISSAYGTRCHQWLKDCQSLTDLGQHFGGTLYEKEVQFLINTEWAQTVEDVLWRRTKQGLYFSAAEVKTLQQWINTN